MPYTPVFNPVKLTVLEAMASAKFECKFAGDLATPGAPKQL